MSRKRRHRLQQKKVAQQKAKPDIIISGPSPELMLIPEEDVDELWIVAENFISAGLEGSELSEDEAKEQCLDGRAQLWIAWSDHCEAVAMTHLIPTPSGLVCVLAACGGENRTRWLGLLEQIEQWARTEDCKAMRIFGRKGWAKVLHGYRVERLILDKEL